MLSSVEIFAMPAFFKNNKSQSSFELIAILSILVFIVLAVLGVILYQSGNAAKDKDRALLEGVANIVSSEVNLAMDVQGDYYREFYLPEVVDGTEYYIAMPGAREVVFTTDQAEYVLFLNDDVVGILKKGSNVIKKTGSIISFNS